MKAGGETQRSLGLGSTFFEQTDLRIELVPMNFVELNSIKNFKVYAWDQLFETLAFEHREVSKS